MCEEEEKLYLWDGQMWGFYDITKTEAPDAKNAKLLSNLSLQECEMECLKSCSCTGFASAGEVSQRGCLAWYGELNDIKQYPEVGQDFYLHVDALQLGMLSQNLN